MTPRQARFVQEYLRDLNATQAAIRAGYSARRARQAGHELVTNRDILAAIEKAQAKRAERVQVTADDVLRILIREAEGKGPDTTSSARVAAARSLGQHLGMWVERVEHSGAVEASAERISALLKDPERLAHALALRGRYGNGSSNGNGTNAGGEQNGD